MRGVDFGPLFRSAVGFDDLPGLLESAARADDATVSYPPYNIEKHDDDDYRVVMAVAGFSEGELDVRTEDRSLIVTGRPDRREDERNFLHRGIARRAFERRFALADAIRVTGATLENGLLHVYLVRELPDHLRPRQVPINGGDGAANENQRTIAGTARRTARAS